MHGAPWARARNLAPLLLALAALDTLAPLPRAAAQMSQPLRGAGVDPVTSGVAKKPVPVYFSVSVEKITEVDEVAYTFSGVFTVVMTWRDPSINSTVNLINFLSRDTLANVKQQVANCSKWAPLIGGTNVPDCQAALAAAGGDCERPCFMSTGVACCDNVWVPGISISNILFIAQDSLELDHLWLYGSTVGPQNGDWSAVYRVVRVQAIFSNVYYFQRFPFDSQLLKFQIAPIPPGNFYVVPSMVGDSFLGSYGFVFQNDSRPFSTKIPFQYYAAGFATNKVTGWQFPSGDFVSMCCDKSCPNNQSDQSAQLTLPPMAPGDPQQYFNTNVYPQIDAYQSNFSEHGAGLLCSICMEVERVSSYYIANTILPVLLNGLLAFTVVFAAPDDLEVRLGTLVTLFLALVAVQFVIADQLPRTEYMTSFTWLVLLSYMVIVALIFESIIVCYISVLVENLEKKKSNKDTLMPAFTFRQTSVKAKEDRASDQEEIAEVGEEEGDGPAPPQDDSEDPEKTKQRKGPLILFGMKPFNYNLEEHLSAWVRDKSRAFTISTWLDNICLAVLGIGYVVAVVLVFVLVKPASMQCSL